MIREKHFKGPEAFNDIQVRQQPMQNPPIFQNICCNQNCQEKFSVNELHQLQNNFKGLLFEARNAFIRACISTNSTNKRVYTIFTKEVCVKFFLQTLKVTPCIVRSALTKWNNGVTKDLRGSHGKHSILSEEKRGAVINHIRKFPTYVSHYKRESSSALYLDPHLNISIMYRLFESEWYASHDKNSENYVEKIPSHTFYYQLFTALGMKFKPLKTDTCKTCDLIKTKAQAASTDDIKKKFLSELLQHQTVGEKLQKEMKDDITRAKIDKSIQVMVFDLQKVLILPKAPSSPLYYTRNFNIYNLNVHEKGNGNFYVWTEIDASRGSREIASCLIRHFKLNLAMETEELILWSDSCSGQNRNHIANHIKQIKLKFLKSGHTYNICDADFGVLEKSIRKHQIICTLDKYLEIMRECKAKNPFIVNQMTKENFYDPKNILKNITKRDYDKTSKENVSWLLTHELKLSKTHEFSLFLKYVSSESYFELNYGKLKRKSGTITSEKWTEVQMGTLFPDGRQLTTAKKKDLLKILNLLPEEGQIYIRKITEGESEDNLEDIDGFSALDFEILNQNEY